MLRLLCFRTEGNDEGGGGDIPSFVLPIVDSLDLSRIDGDDNGKDISRSLTRSMIDDEKQWMDNAWRSHCIVQFMRKRQENNEKKHEIRFYNRGQTTFATGLKRRNRNRSPVRVSPKFWIKPNF